MGKLNNDGGRMCLDLLTRASSTFTTIPRTSKNKVRFNAFANSLGSTKRANICTKVGYLAIDVNSQFWKMLKCKENRASVLMNIRDTLKEPLLIAVDGDSTFFFNSFKKQNGERFNMVCVCGESEGEFVLKTSYELRKTAKIEQFLQRERGQIIYKKKDHPHNRDNGNKMKLC